MIPTLAANTGGDSPQYLVQIGAERHSVVPPQTRPLAGTPPGQDKDDLLDQHVAHYLQQHPDVHRHHTLIRKTPGVYELDGREVLVEWQHAAQLGEHGFLVVVDGPLRQPLRNYLERSEANAEYG